MGKYVKKVYPEGTAIRSNGRPDPRKGKITPRQETFCKLVTEGIYSNAECARRAGFAAAHISCVRSEDAKREDFPHVLERIQEMREERERKYGVSTIGQLKRLHDLSRGAEEAGQYSSAINAEKIRSALGGLTIDRRENINTMDQMSRDEITARLAALQQQYPQAFQIEGTPMKDVTPNEQGTRGEILEYIEEQHATKGVRSED